MLSDLLNAAAAGRSVYVSEVRELLRTIPGTSSVTCVLTLPDGGRAKMFEIPLPSIAHLCTDAERSMVFRYAQAEVYNHLTVLGGTELTCYVPEEDGALRTLVDEVVDTFQVESPRGERTGFARVLNVLDRMINALHGGEGGSRRFTISVVEGKPPATTEALRFRANRSDALREASAGLEGRSLCGLDIGGTDIKASLAVDGAIVAMKEHDWNPGAYANVEEITGPIIAIVRLMRARAAIARNGEAFASDLADRVDSALQPNRDVEEMNRAADAVEEAFGSRMKGLDAIGLCFPDVVVRNQIVGGEVPKTQGMRANPRRDFEEQFARLTALHIDLAAFCAPGGVVGDVNDGPMAAFTAAVELAASADGHSVDDGVFAHSLGTDLGTGIVLADGTIPEIPLEVFNAVIDLGNDPARSYAVDDLRSLRSSNTGISGSPQKLAGQAAAFRLVDELLRVDGSDTLDSFVEAGFVASRESGDGTVYYVPESPVDQRKPYLSNLMSLAERNEAVAEVFRRIGEYLAAIWRETEHILDTGLTKRFLFGRFVKVPRVFELMREGAKRVEPSLELVAADAEMAFTPLMKELSRMDHYTVAQFGQAIGAIHYANLLLRSGG